MSRRVGHQCARKTTVDGPALAAPPRVHTSTASPATRGCESDDEMRANLRSCGGNMPCAQLVLELSNPRRDLWASMRLGSLPCRRRRGPRRRRSWRRRAHRVRLLIGQDHVRANRRSRPHPRQHGVGQRIGSSPQELQRGETHAGRRPSSTETVGRPAARPPQSRPADVAGSGRTRRPVPRRASSARRPATELLPGNGGPLVAWSARSRPVRLVGLGRFSGGPVRPVLGRTPAAACVGSPR